MGMSSWHGDAFRITDPLWEDSIGHRWTPLTKGQQRRALMFSLVYMYIGTNGWTNSGVAGVWDAMTSLWHSTWRIILARPVCSLRKSFSLLFQHDQMTIHCMCQEACWCHCQSFLSLHWRHNDHDGVSNHQPFGCFLNRLFRRRSKKTSKLRVTGLCEKNSPGPVNSPHKGPVTRKMFPFDDVIMSGVFWNRHSSLPLARMTNGAIQFGNDNIVVYKCYFLCVLTCGNQVMDRAPDVLSKCLLWLYTPFIKVSITHNLPIWTDSAPLARRGCGLAYSSWDLLAIAANSSKERLIDSLGVGCATLERHRMVNKR